MSTTLPTNVSLSTEWKSIIIITSINQPSTIHRYTRRIINEHKMFMVPGYYYDGAEFCINFSICQFSSDLSSVSFSAGKAWNAHYGMTNQGTLTSGGFILKILVEK